MTKSLNHKIFPSTSCTIKLGDCMVKLCHIIEICRIIEVAASIKELQIFLAMTVCFTKFSLPLWKAWLCTFSFQSNFYSKNCRKLFRPLNFSCLFPDQFKGSLAHRPFTHRLTDRQISTYAEIEDQILTRSAFFNSWKLYILYNLIRF